MILTPTYDGKLELRYAQSLVQTYLSIPMQYRDGNTHLQAEYCAGNALLCSARNLLLAKALDFGADQVIWIDSDTVWDPADFWKLVGYDVDFVGGMVPQRTPEARACVMLLPGEQEGPIIEVESTGCAFLKVSGKALRMMADASPQYRYDKVSAWKVFEEGITPEGGFQSEDIGFCRLWRRLGGKIYLDPEIKCGHTRAGVLYELPK
jgi:hypothetical protein